MDATGGCFWGLPCGGCPLRRVALSVSLRETAPPKGGRGLPCGGIRCGGVTLSVPLRGTAPPRGEPRGNGGDVLHRFCKYFVSCNPVGQGLCPCLTPRRWAARAEPLPYGAKRPRKRSEDWGVLLPRNNLFVAAATSPLSGETRGWDTEPSSKSPASPERGGARRSGRRGSPRPPQPSWLPPWGSCPAQRD
jgi:hypothetical protein